MEMENKTYDWRNINAKANAGLTTGIVSLAGWLFGGGLSNTFGGNCNGGGCSENQLVNRYEMSMQRDLSNKDMEIAYLKGREETRKDLQDFFAYSDKRISNIESQIAGQAVWNATQTGLISCMQSQIAALQGLTKIVVPADNICPQPMSMYNSWTAPAAPTTGA